MAHTRVRGDGGEKYLFCSHVRAADGVARWGGLVLPSRWSSRNSVTFLNSPARYVWYTYCPLLPPRPRQNERPYPLFRPVALRTVSHPLPYGMELIHRPQAILLTEWVR